MNLDQHAGGRVRPEVAEAVARLLGADLANPSSAHAAGRRARDLVEEARDRVAALVGARPAEVVFTSGGTEANNLAIGGVAGADFVSTAIEHASVLRALEAVRESGARVELVPVAADGRVDPERIASHLRPGTSLVSVGWANGEIGTIQPVAEIVRAVRERAPLAHVHSDAVQAAATQPLDFASSGLDSLSLSGHKLGALPGVGALVVRTGVSLRPLLRGGPHERGRRAGTENVFGIASFGVAAGLALDERDAFRERAAALRERLWQALRVACTPVVRFGRDDGVPTTLAVAFSGTRGDALVVALDLAGIACSTGSACAAGGSEPSHVLRAIGVEPGLAGAALRLSFGREADELGIDRAIGRVAEVVGRARAQAAPLRGHAGSDSHAA